MAGNNVTVRSVDDIRRMIGGDTTRFSDEDVLSMFSKAAGVPEFELANTLGYDTSAKAGPWREKGSAAVDGYQSGLLGVGEAVAGRLGLSGVEDSLARRRRANDFAATVSNQRAEQGGIANSYEDVDWLSPSSVGKYVGGLGIQSLPYLAEAAVGGFAGRAIAGGAKAAQLAAAGDAAAAARLGRASTIGGTIASYPSAVGDILNNQREQNGETNLGAAMALGVPYALLNGAFGLEGLAARGSLPSVGNKTVREFIDGVDGIKGVGLRTATTAAKTGLAEGFSETAQEGINQFGRMAVDPTATLTDPDAIRRYKESFVAGGLLGGAVGAAGGGWRRGEKPSAPPLDDSGTTDILNRPTPGADSYYTPPVTPLLSSYDQSEGPLVQPFAEQPAQQEPNAPIPGQYDLFNPDGGATYAADNYQPYTEREVRPKEADMVRRQFEDSLVGLQLIQEKLAQDPDNKQLQDQERKATEVALQLQDRWESVKQMATMSPGQPYQYARSRARGFDEAVDEGRQRQEMLSPPAADPLAAVDATAPRGVRLGNPAPAPAQDAPAQAPQVRPEVMAQIESMAPMLGGLVTGGFLTMDSANGAVRMMAAGDFAGAKKIIDAATKQKKAADALTKLAQPEVTPAPAPTTAAVTAATAAPEPKAPAKPKAEPKADPAPRAVPKAKAMLDEALELEKQGFLGDSDIAGLSTLVAKSKFGQAQRILDKARADKVQAEQVAAAPTAAPAPAPATTTALKAAPVVEAPVEPAQAAAPEPKKEPKPKKVAPTRLASPAPTQDNLSPAQALYERIRSLKKEAASLVYKNGRAPREGTERGDRYWQLQEQINDLMAEWAMLDSAERKAKKTTKAEQRQVETVEQEAQGETEQADEAAAEPEVDEDVAPITAAPANPAPAAPAETVEAANDPDVVEMDKRIEALELERGLLLGQGGRAPIPGTAKAAKYRSLGEEIVTLRAERAVMARPEKTRVRTKSSAFDAIATQATEMGQAARDRKDITRERMELAVEDSRTAEFKELVDNATELVKSGLNFPVEQGSDLTEVRLPPAKFLNEPRIASATAPYYKFRGIKILAARAEYLRNNLKGRPLDLSKLVEIRNLLDAVEYDIRNEVEYNEKQSSDAYVELMVYGKRLENIANSMGLRFTTVRSKAGAKPSVADGDFKALKGKKVRQEFKVAGSQDTATIEMDADVAMRELARRESVLEQLRLCVGA